MQHQRRQQDDLLFLSQAVIQESARESKKSGRKKQSEKDCFRGDPPVEHDPQCKQEKEHKPSKFQYFFDFIIP